MLKKFRVKVNGKDYIVEVEELQNSSNEIPTMEKQALSSQAPTSTPIQASVEKKAEETVKSTKTPTPSTGGSLISPMTGIILEVLVSPGDRVSRGDKVIVMEAMKMENSVLADRDGIIKEVRVKKGESVNAGDVMVVFE